jgi:hypothetical protein
MDFTGFVKAVKVVKVVIMRSENDLPRNVEDELV